MTGGNKMGARAGDDTRTGLGPGIAGFDPTSGADPIFSAASRSEEQQQAQQTSSQVNSALLLDCLLYSQKRSSICGYGPQGRMS